MTSPHTIQNGQLPSGRYRHDAYWYYGGVWKFGGYAELTVANAQSAAAVTSSDDAVWFAAQGRPEIYRLR